MKLFSQGSTSSEGVVSQELNDLGNVTNERRGFGAFPVADGCFVNGDFSGNLLLKESEVQAAFAEVVA